MPETIIDNQDTAVEVHRLVVGPVDNNVYIVRCRESGDSLLIDAANEHDLLLELCRDLNVRQVVETHGHWDHIQAVEAVRDAGIDVAVTRATRLTATRASDANAAIHRLAAIPGAVFMRSPIVCAATSRGPSVPGPEIDRPTG